MNFDTRTILDIIVIDPDLEIVLNILIDAEKILWLNSGKIVEKDFVRSVIPLIKDELRFYMATRLRPLNLEFIKKLVNLDNVDYFQLIPAITKI